MAPDVTDNRGLPLSSAKASFLLLHSWGFILLIPDRKEPLLINNGSFVNLYKIYFLIFLRASGFGKSSFAWAAAKRATGTRNGEQLT